MDEDPYTSRSRFIHLISNVETRNFEYISIRMLMNFINEYPVPSLAQALNISKTKEIRFSYLTLILATPYFY